MLRQRFPFSTLRQSWMHHWFVAFVYFLLPASLTILPLFLTPSDSTQIFFFQQTPFPFLVMMAVHKMFTPTLDFCFITMLTMLQFYNNFLTYFSVLFYKLHPPPHYFFVVLVFFIISQRRERNKVFFIKQNNSSKNHATFITTGILNIRAFHINIYVIYLM